jgi:hypothetical protein
MALELKKQEEEPGFERLEFVDLKESQPIYLGWTGGSILPKLDSMK